MTDGTRPPLLRSQVAAAAWIHDGRKMPGWNESEGALDRLRIALPGWDVESVLVKTAAVNQLYRANHYRLDEVAKRIVRAWDKGRLDPSRGPIAIVQAVACPAVWWGGKSYYCWAFASKFAHFFIDPHRVPVYDKWAYQAVEHHLGKVKWDAPTGYRTFVGRVESLRQKVRPCTVRALDRYLWLSGMYRAGRGRKERAMKDLGLGEDVRALFLSGEQDINDALAQLVWRPPP
jgi:hypothetical protein